MEDAGGRPAILDITLQRYYLVGAGALLALAYVEFYGITLLEDGTVDVVCVHKKIVAAILFNEPVTLALVEPFDFAL